MRALVIAIVTLAAPAFAQAPDDKARAEAIYAEGQELYAASNFAAAADRFKAAWALDPDPAYLFNVAQAYRALHRCSDAATYYHRFLDQVASAPNLDKVHAYLAEVEACAHKNQPAPPPAPVAQTRSSMRVAGVGIGIGGVVALGVGAGFAWHVQSLETTREQLCPLPCRWTTALTDRANDLQHKGDRASLITIAATTVGVAAVATGVVMYWLGAPAHVEVAPRAGGAVVSTQVAF